MGFPPQDSHSRAPFILAPSMAKSGPIRSKATSFLSESFLFICGTLVTILALGTLWSFLNPKPDPDFSSLSPFGDSLSCAAGAQSFNLTHDPPLPTFYDDPTLTYTIDKKITKWDEKRKQWLRHHPSFAAGVENRILLLSGSQPSPCKNPIGDHLLLRFFKNKVDYCRIHGCDVFYNNALLHPKMTTFWAKLPVVKAAMLAHPEAEWIWWVDSDALFTDMEFTLPLGRYKAHNLVVHGWAHLIYEKKSWVSLNAGVFLIRNCQWSMDFMDVWASMGPQTPNYDSWGKIQKSIFKDKMFPESDDQTALVYLLLKERDKWADKIYLEGEYYFEGYWSEIIGTLENITSKHVEIERGVRTLRRRHAEKVGEFYGVLREEYLVEAGNGRGSWRRPFITHFTGCQPCSGAHNQMYAGQSCWDGMNKALNFADNQVLRKYGFVHPSLLDSNSVNPLPYDSAA
ncbi:Glycosyltransferase 34 [Dillenia turbinata]|uniref:Glycosyltransferase 34 n=1 Tax=Dillenia turbinata TaxID=194707 RepID=A0AAN8Z3A8_9MAGN